LAQVLPPQPAMAPKAKGKAKAKASPGPSLDLDGEEGLDMPAAPKEDKKSKRAPPGYGLPGRTIKIATMEGIQAGNAELAQKAVWVMEYAFTQDPEVQGTPEWEPLQVRRAVAACKAVQRLATDTRSFEALIRVEAADVSQRLSVYGNEIGDEAHTALQLLCDFALQYLWDSVLHDHDAAIVCQATWQLIAVPEVVEAGLWAMGTRRLAAGAFDICKAALSKHLSNLKVCEGALKFFSQIVQDDPQQCLDLASRVVDALVRHAPFSWESALYGARGLCVLYRRDRVYNNKLPPPPEDQNSSPRPRRRNPAGATEVKDDSRYLSWAGAALRVAGDRLIAQRQRQRATTLRTIVDGLPVDEAKILEVEAAVAEAERAEMPGTYSRPD